MTVLHELDRSKTIRLLQDLYAVGERPSYEEFKSYLDELWPAWPDTRKQVRGFWNTILRDPHHKFRRIKDFVRFTVLDWLVEQHGLQTIDERLWEVASQALTDFHRTALEDPDLEAWLAARRTLRSAVQAIDGLRRMRLGPRATGDWLGMDASTVSAAEVSEWGKLKTRYARI